MHNYLKPLAFAFTLVFALISGNLQAESTKTQVKLITNKGDIVIELFDSKTPKTVTNFVNYVNSGFYTNTVFHRVIPNFMIQGGGFSKDLKRKSTNAPIVNEADPFIPNLRGTISMARTSNPHSATSQFFINTVDNRSLNKSSLNPGYAVFGKVTKGMDVVDIISATKTGVQSGMRDVPKEPIIISSAMVLKEEKPKENNP